MNQVERLSFVSAALECFYWIYVSRVGRKDSAICPSWENTSINQRMETAAGFCLFILGTEFESDDFDGFSSFESLSTEWINWKFWSWVHRTNCGGYCPALPIWDREQKTRPENVRSPRKGTPASQTTVMLIWWSPTCGASALRASLRPRWSSAVNTNPWACFGWHSVWSPHWLSFSSFQGYEPDMCWLFCR